MGRISGMWQEAKFYCGCHDEKCEMSYQQGKSLFLACPNYKSVNGSRSCPNRISVDEADGIITDIAKKIADLEQTTLVPNIKGYRFKYKDRVDAIVTGYDADSNELEISVVNTRAIRMSGGKI